MEKKTILMAFSFMLIIQIASASALTETYYPVSGEDASDGGIFNPLTNDDILKLSAIDDNRMRSDYPWDYSLANWDWDYIRYDFAIDTSEMETINDVTFFTKWQRDSDMDFADIIVWDGSDWSTEYGLTVPAEFSQYIYQEFSFENINTKYELQNLQIKFRAKSSDWRDPSFSFQDVLGVRIDYEPVYQEETPEILDVSWNPENPYEIINAVTFTADVQTTDGICGWDWDFGDGEESFDSEPIHIYARSDTFEVELTVTDCIGGEQDTYSENIAVGDLLPEACFIGDFSVEQHQTGSYDASCSYHADDLVSYEWDWTNDGSYDDAGIVQSHQWSTIGAFTIKLRVTDDEGNWNATIHQVTVNDDEVPEIMDILWNPAEPYEIIDSVEFSAEIVSEDGVCSWEWNFGDLTPHSNEEFPVHTYMSSDVFEVKLTVQDCDDGDIDIYSEQIIVGDILPVACFTGSDELFVNEQGSYNAGCSCHQSDGLTYQWDWENDGTFDDTGKTQTHSWSSPGTFTIKLKVKDDENNWNATTMEVVVEKKHDFDIPLDAGLNFISIPLVPEDDDISIENVLNSVMVNTEIVWYRDINYQWQSFIPEYGGNFDEIMPGIGFYIIMSESDTLYVDGGKMYQNPAPYPPEVTLIDGWQMIGHYGLLTITDTEALTSMQTIVYDPEGQLLEIINHYTAIFDEFGTPVSTFEPGKGYWINVRLDEYIDDSIKYVPSEAAYNY